MKNPGALGILLIAAIIAFVIFGRTEFRSSAPAGKGVPETVAPVPSEAAKTDEKVLAPNMHSNASLPLPINSPETKVVEKSSVPPRAENESSVHADFKKRIQTAEATLAKSAMMKGKTAEEVHHTPPEIIRSAESIGRVAEAIEKDPELTREALPFFLKCALDSEGMAATRALCAYRLDVYKDSWDAEMKAGVAKIPDAIRKLKEKIAD